MKVTKALELTGKAYREDNGADYVMLVNNTEGSGSLLHWFNDGEDIGEVVFEEQIDDIWQPYPEVKEIRPKSSEEVWVGSHGRHMVTGWREGELWGYFNDGSKCTVLDKGSLVIHGKNGWDRLIPSVEDESVDRIEIETIFEFNEDGRARYRFDIKEDRSEMGKFDNSVAILLIPKKKS